MEKNLKNEYYEYLMSCIEKVEYRYEFLEGWLNSEVKSDPQIYTSEQVLNIIKVLKGL